MKKVKVEVVAIDKGYYKGEVVPMGKKFTYEGMLSPNGKLPLWVEGPKDFYKKLASESKKESEVKKEEPKKGILEKASDAVKDLM